MDASPSRSFANRRVGERTMTTNKKMANAVGRSILGAAVLLATLAPHRLLAATPTFVQQFGTNSGTSNTNATTTATTVPAAGVAAGATIILNVVLSINAGSLPAG